MIDKLGRLEEMASQRSDRFDIFYIQRYEKDFVFTDKGVIGFELNESDQTSLRINCGGGIGFASSAGPFDAADLFEFAVETSKFNKGSLPQLCDNMTVNVNIFDEQIEKLEHPQILACSEEIMAEIESLTLQYECRFKTVMDNIIFMREGGLVKSYKKSMLKVSFDGINGAKEYFNYRQASCKYFDFVNEVKVSVNRQMNQLPFTDDIECKTVNVILTPFALYCAMKNFIALKFNAKISAGEEKKSSSYYPGLSVYDNGIEDWKIGSQPFDDEGIACQDTPLMKNGVINTFYYDIISANKLGVKSTGNGKRGWCIPPSPVPNNLIIKGDIGTENLLDILDHGILIDYIVSDGRTDVINGIFYGSIKRGNYIRGGKKVSSVSGINVCIDFNKTLQEGAVFGNDDTWIGGEFCSPSLLLNGVEIIG